MTLNPNINLAKLHTGIRTVWDMARTVYYINSSFYTGFEPIDITWRPRYALDQSQTVSLGCYGLAILSLTNGIMAMFFSQNFRCFLDSFLCAVLISCSNPSEAAVFLGISVPKSSSSLPR